MAPVSDVPLFLVPVDFSVYSDAAIDYAADLCERLGGALKILHVVHDPGEAPGYYRVEGREEMLRTLEDVARDMLRDFALDAAKRNPGRHCVATAERLLVVGLPVSRILEIIDEVEPDLVVMGSAGRTGLSHALIGSKAEQVTRLSPVPVLIVKRPKERS